MKLTNFVMTSLFFIMSNIAVFPFHIHDTWSTTFIIHQMYYSKFIRNAEKTHLHLDSIVSGTTNCTVHMFPYQRLTSHWRHFAFLVWRQALEESYSAWLTNLNFAFWNVLHRPFLAGKGALTEWNYCNTRAWYANLNFVSWNIFD